MKIFKRIATTCSLILLLIGYIKLTNYSQIYDQSINEILAIQPKEFFLINTKTVDSKVWTSKYVLFSGVQNMGTFQSKEKLKINITTKKGESRVILVDTLNHEMWVDVSGEENIIDTNNKEYDVLVVGKYFVGNIVLENND